MTTHAGGCGRRVLAASAVLALGLGLAACGVGESDDDEVTRTSTTGVPSIDRSDLEPTDAPPTASPTEGATTDVDPAVIADRHPVPGLVEIEGTAGSLTARARASYALTERDVTVTETRSGEGCGFQRLCIGDVDVVDSSRPMSADEHEQCRRNGLDVVQLQVAADAAVLAIGSQTDVGTDCLSTDQVRATFRAGSTITSWQQLDPDLESVELETGGPTVDVDAARYFGRTVLATEDPLAADFRVDYQASESENRTLGFVTGSPDDRVRVRDLTFVEPEWTEQRAQLETSQSERDRAQAEVRAALAEQRKGVRGGRSPAARAEDDARVTRAYADRARETAELDADEARFALLDATYRDLVGRQRRIADALGRVGVFSHGYYATFEDRLRPFEIEVSDGDDQPSCIFPSPQTILSGDYPLSRRLLLTVTTRSLQRPEVRSFLTSYLAGSQRYADDAGLVAMPAEDVRTQRAWLADHAEPPRFGIVDGELTELTEETAATPAAPSPAPAERPAQ